MKIKIFLLVILTIFLAGCAKGGEEKQEDRPLHIAVSTEPDSFDPYISSATDTEAILFNIYEGLIGFDEKGDLIPLLSKDWAIEGSTYTFNLRDDVSFHDGRKFTAADVVDCFTKLAGLNGEAPLSAKYSALGSVTAVNDYQVQMILTETDSSFLSKCTRFIIPAGYENSETAPVGTGPYKFKEYNPGQSVVLTINENYYNNDRAGKIKEAHFLIMPDDNAKILALRSGSVDIFEAAKEIISQLPDEYMKHSGLYNLVQLLVLNNEEPPFDNIDVRRAMNYAVNREEIIDLTTGDSGYGVYTTFTPAMVWYNNATENVYSYDIEKAKALLKTAGYENGFDMEIIVPSDYALHVNTAQVIVNQLAKIGVNASIKQMDFAQWLEDVYFGGIYSATVTGLSGKIDPYDIGIRFYSTYARNFYNFNSVAYDELVEMAVRETDEARKRELYNEMQMVLTEEAAAVFIQDPGKDVACVKELKGFKSYPVSFWDLSSLYFE